MQAFVLLRGMLQQCRTEVPVLSRRVKRHDHRTVSFVTPCVVFSYYGVESLNMTRLIPDSTVSRMVDMDRDWQFHEEWLHVCAQASAAPALDWLELSDLHDSDGRPCCWVRAAKFGFKGLTVDDMKVSISRAMNELIERADKAHDGNYCIVLDMDGFSVLQNFDLKLIKLVVDHMYSHYPRRLHAMFVLNYGVIFQTAWAVASKLLRESTTEKTILVEDLSLHLHRK